MAESHVTANAALRLALKDVPEDVPERGVLVKADLPEVRVGREVAREASGCAIYGGAYEQNRRVCAPGRWVGPRPLEEVVAA